MQIKLWYINYFLNRRLPWGMTPLKNPVFQWQLLWSFGGAQKHHRALPKSPVKLQLPYAHYKVKILVCENYWINLHKLTFDIKNTFFWQNKLLKSLTCQSNTLFSVYTKSNTAAGTIKKHACNVITDIAVP